MVEREGWITIVLRHTDWYKVRTEDGKLDVQLSLPKEMGGDNKGTNPEQLFAVGYSGCYLGAIRFVAGKEKVVIPWHEASLFTPPDKWFHQHFNLGGKPARYLAFHPPAQFSGYSEKVEDRKKDQIEYPFEEPWIREKFEGELKARGLTTLMPDQAYKDDTFEWDYNASGD